MNPPMNSLMATYNRADLAFVEGDGPWLTADNGRRFLDFGAGVAVNSLGYAHPRLVAALTDQASRPWHVSNLYRIPRQEELASRLTDASFADRVFFANSGAEAMECAIKIARRHHAATPGRHDIITFDGAFHGRTLATLSAAARPALLDGFTPALQGFVNVPFADAAALEAAITGQTAAILLEPIQGEGGIRPAPDSFLKTARALCDRHGLLLIFDEVQTGAGRTGKLFAHEWSGVFPDILAAAKGLGGGFPLGACLTTEQAAKTMTAGSHGSTFGGNPLAMAVGNAVLDVILTPGFLDAVQDTARHLQQELTRLHDHHPDLITDIRGRGLMMGVETRLPATELVAAARERDLLIVAAGAHVVRLVPPLIITPEHVSEAVSRLDAACTDLAGGASSASAVPA